MDTRLFAEWATLVKLISYLLTYLLTYLSSTFKPVLMQVA